MARSSRLEPTVFLAMVSPITVGLVAGTVALVLLLDGPWWLAVLSAVAVWALRVGVASAIARRVSALPARIDPFALREPWRFFVRDALQARTKFFDAVERAQVGPRRTRLEEIGLRVQEGVEESWQVARRGQHLTDTRRAIDTDSAHRVLAGDLADDDPRRSSAQVQIDSHTRLAQLEESTRERLEILDARLEESVVRAAELAVGASATDQLNELADAVDGIVGDLEALRFGLDSAEDTSGEGSL